MPKTSPKALARIKAWREANPDKVRAYRLAYYHRKTPPLTPEQRAEKTRARKAAYREANREKARAYSKAYYYANRERLLVLQKAYNDARPEQVAAKNRAWYLANKERVAAWSKEYLKRRRDRINLRTLLRQKRCKLATPPWSDKAALRDIYMEAAYFQLQVDHIIPIKHKLVCGLHVPANLQLLTPEQNKRKGNKFEVDHAR